MSQFRHGDMAENKTALGAYVVLESEGDRAVTLLASGSEVGVAIDAQTKLATEGIAAAVVSVPCLELFWMQNADYRNQVLGTSPRIVIEAGMRQSWDRLLSEDDGFVGMDSFGASAPINDLYAHFGITSDAVVEQAKAIIR
jgi:transketolase